MAKRLHFIGPGAGDFTDDEIAYLARYFASAASAYPRDDKPPGVFWIPWAWGSELRRYWLAARDEVARRIPARAFALINRMLDSDDATQPESWPTAERREVYALCVPTGCRYRVCVCGHVIGVNDKCPTEGCGSNP